MAQTLAYLNGDVEYAQIHRLYAAQIETENFRSSVDEYRLYTLKQLLWMLPPMQRNRLLHLMLNHDYRGFKLLEGQHEKAWLLELLQQGEIDFEQYLEQEREEESSENGMHFLLKWLVDLEVNPAHITLFCIKNAEFAICCDFIQHHARGNFGRFADTLDYLHAGRRAQLPQILSQAEDGAQLVELLSKDKSRVVKEAVAKYLVV
ncbi:hypothetical protein [Vibrio taketomensis]|uniref:hypothetical protein n=1 Tax=Vibrio taketomensis TaxID=2572923 RepID=UPI001E3B5BD7|nr:hypothetical protein [Vibrio taketomensis]